MPRAMHGEQSETFRAVVTKVFPAERDYGAEERTVVTYYGPYATKGAAASAITYEKRQAAYRSRYRPGPTVTGRVERSSVVWEPVE